MVIGTPGMGYSYCQLRIYNTVNQVYLAAIKFGGFATFWVIIEVFSYIILFDFCPNAKFNSMPNLDDLQ